MRECICQICICGRHRCEHVDKRRSPYAKDDTGLPISEHRERYCPFGFQKRQEPVRPPSDSRWRGDEPSVKISTTRKDFVAFPIKKRPIMRPKAPAESKDKMDSHSTYQHDFLPKTAIPTSKVRGDEPRKDGTMPGTLPGKIEGATTYRRSYTPQPYQKTDISHMKASTLTELGLPFTGQTETGVSFRRPPYQKREPASPKRGVLKHEGEFDDTTTHKADYLPKYQVPARPIKKFPKWLPGQGKFESDTTHKHDYKYPSHAEKTIILTPKPDLHMFKGLFEGKSHYKQDYQPHELHERKLPPWHPSYLPYKRSPVPFEAGTTYATDYEAPPEDLPHYEPHKPIRCNLTIPSDPMEKLTTFMKDYRKIHCPVPTKSFKPDAKYELPKEKLDGWTITRQDFTPKHPGEMVRGKASDNLKTGYGAMDCLSMTRKDFQWLARECPATFLKLFGKDALPEYEFDKVEGGHTFFKKRRKTKNWKETPPIKRAFSVK